MDLGQRPARAFVRALGLYNVQRLPANFLIDKEGTIVAKNIYGKSLEAKLDELTK